jgi:hypothetical protein
LAVSFQQVSFLELVETLEGYATFSAGGHFIHFITEVAQAGYGRFVNLLPIPQQPHRGSPGYAAFEDPTARNLDAPARRE